MTNAERLPVLVGEGPLLGRDGTPVRWTRAQAQRWGDRAARRKVPKGFWRASICRTPAGFWRVGFGGQPER